MLSCRAETARDAGGVIPRIAGESMTGAGLFPGDIAVVDCARTAVDGSIVLALLAGEFTGEALSQEGRADLAASREPGV